MAALQKILVDDGLSGAHEMISDVIKLHPLQRPMGAEGYRGRSRRSKASRCWRSKIRRSKRSGVRIRSPRPAGSGPGLEDK